MTPKTATILTIMVISLSFNVVGFSVLMDNEAEIESLNNTVEQVVKMHNEKNHELNVIKDDMFWIRHVNGELLEKCDPSTVNKVNKKDRL